MPDLVIEMHRRRTPIDHPMRSITREHLEYPTENVSFAYLATIDRVGGGIYSYGSFVVTKDGFADKSVFGITQVNTVPVVTGRYLDKDNLYYSYLYPPASTSDHVLAKRVNGSKTTLATENVDINSYRGEGLAISCTGSTIKSLRWDTGGFLDPLNLPTATAVISATDTSFTSGYYGYRFLAESSPHGGVGELSAYLLPAMTTLQSAKAIIEYEVTGEGTENNPIRPKLIHKLIEISRLTNIPDFLKQEAKRYELLKRKGFSDEEIELMLGYIPQHQVDLASVTWGVFDHKPGHNTMLIVVTGDNPYMKGAIEKQVEYAKAKGLKVLKPPRSYREAIEQYRELKKDFSEWIAGKDNYAYQTLGHEVLELFQVADTYYGNIVEGIKPDAYKNVPDWEMRRTLSMWIEKLKKVSVLVEERDKHVRKIDKVLRLGW